MMRSVKTRTSEIDWNGIMPLIKTILVAVLLFAGCTPRQAVRTASAESAPASAVVEQPREKDSRGKLFSCTIYFVADKTVLTPEALTQLYKTGAYMNAHPGYRLIITGHADEGFSNQYAERVADKRAKSVAEWLVNFGLKADRLEVRGFGRSKPFKKDCGDDANCRGLNRRVEIIAESR